MAIGYTQTNGIGYEETFSLVAKLNIVRILLFLYENLDWPLDQYNVKNVFLHGDIEKEVYMDIPPGYVVPLQDKLVCKLEQALNDTKEIAKIQMQLSTKFKMKNLGGLKYFLGIEVVKSYEDNFISQKKYVLDLLSKHMQNLSKRHMKAIIRILHYLKSAPRRGIMFSKNNHLNKIYIKIFHFCWGNLVTWKSKKQKVVALSSAEAKFRKMCKGLCKLLVLMFEPKKNINLFCDNKATIEIAPNHVQHDRTKHEEKMIIFAFVQSEDQLVDMLTNDVSSKMFLNSLDKLGIKDIYAPT
ncbi:hypothetical protein CR513_47812, partial [Mucuna pruriens]